MVTPRNSPSATDPASDQASERMPWGGFGRLAPLSLLVALALMVVAGGAGYEITARRTPTYLAGTALNIDEPIAIARSQDAGVINKLSQLRFKYAGLIRRDDIQAAAARIAGVPAGVVGGSAYARVDSGTLLMFVGARSADPRTAVRISNALATALTAYVTSEQSQAAIQPADRVHLDLVSPARGAAQILPTKRQKITSGAGAALVVFVIAAAALDVIRRRRES